MERRIREWHFTTLFCGFGWPIADGFIISQGRKYLDYDLEALYAHIKSHESKQVTVAFQDSEAFDTDLLSDLITLFR